MAQDVSKDPEQRLASSLAILGFRLDQVDVPAPGKVTFSLEDVERMAHRLVEWSTLSP